MLHPQIHPPHHCPMSCHSTVSPSTQPKLQPKCRDLETIFHSVEEEHGNDMPADEEIHTYRSQRTGHGPN